jgi:hypothetical protein
MSEVVNTDRGESLGFLYLARRPCGKVSAMCWDDPVHKKETAAHVADYIKRGDIVERIERFRNDPQPEWICRRGCSDCRQDSPNLPS